MSPSYRIPLVTVVAGTLLAAMILLAGCNRDRGDTVAPSIRYTFPLEFTILSNIATVRVEAGDNVGIAQVFFLAEGDTVGQDSQEPYAFGWNTSAYPDCTGADSYILLTAAAIDFAGNMGTAQRKFFLDNAGLPPLPVELFEPTNVTKHSATLAWETSLDWDFSHYILRRDTAATVTVSADSLVRSDDPDATTFADAGEGISPFGLLEDTEYHYRIFVHDTFGRSRASDSIATIHTLLPQPVKLVAGEPPSTKYTATLQWEPSDEDVAYFRLHRGPVPQRANLDSIAVFTPGNYTYRDTGLTADSTYYYYLYLVDEAGYTHNFSSADVVEVRTEALPAPVLNTPLNITKYSATIGWAGIPPQEDNSWVTLYRDITAIVDTGDVVVYDSLRNALPSYQDTSLSQGQTYYYRMYHIDTRNNTAWSNTLALTTKSLADVWSGGLGVDRQGKVDLDLSWDPYTWTAVEDDFAGYTLTRNTATVFSSSVPTDNRFPDGDLTRATPYTYRLTVSDTSGASTAVTLNTSTRDIFPADIVSLEPTILWFFQLRWLPSQEPSVEFSHYTILRSANPNAILTDGDNNNMADCLQTGDCVEVNPGPGPVQGTFGIDTLKYDDQDPGLVQGTLTNLPIYNYVVLTYDQAGGYAPSNVVGDTLYLPPDSVTVEVVETTENTISLSWSRASWPWPALEPVLFSRYEVWRNTTSGQVPGDPESTYQLVHTIPDSIDVTTYTNGGLAQGWEYAYRVILVDRLGQTAISEEITPMTKL